MAIKALLEWLTEAKPEEVEKVAKGIAKGVKAYRA